MDCIFCKIVNGEIPSKKVYEDDMCLAFHDLNPQTPVHVLFIPKKHICCANEVNEENAEYVAHIFTVIPKVAKELGVENGYRLINNCGADAGQTVMHLHFHLLGGKKLDEKIV